MAKIIQIKKTSKKKLCPTCKVNPADSPHPCPYAEDINNNHDQKYCTCCAACTHECRMDI